MPKSPISRKNHSHLCVKYPRAKHTRWQHLGHSLQSFMPYMTKPRPLSPLPRKVLCPSIPGQCIVRLSSLDITGWPVGVVYSQDEVLAPVRDYQEKTVIAALAILLALLFTVMLIARRHTQPV